MIRGASWGVEINTAQSLCLCRIRLPTRVLNVLSACEQYIRARCAVPPFREGILIPARNKCPWLVGMASVWKLRVADACQQQGQQGLVCARSKEREGDARDRQTAELRRHQSSATPFWVRSLGRIRGKAQCRLYVPEDLDILESTEYLSNPKG